MAFDVFSVRDRVVQEYREYFESFEQGQAIIEDPPHVLLTNYVML